MRLLLRLIATALTGGILWVLKVSLLTSQYATSLEHQEARARAKLDPHVHFETCLDVERAGIMPLRRDDPGYRRGLDSDRDGIACNSDQDLRNF